MDTAAYTCIVMYFTLQLWKADKGVIGYGKNSYLKFARQSTSKRRCRKSVVTFGSPYVNSYKYVS